MTNREIIVKYIKYFIFIKINRTITYINGIQLYLKFGIKIV
jgi:hypothetical protein